MKVIILHGTGSSPDSYWIPYITQNLQHRGYEVIVPVLPNTNNPTLEDSLEAALKLSYDEETIVIGHSSGAALILSVLENLEVNIKQAILVAGFFEPLNPPHKEPMVQETYNWKKIKYNCENFIFINSDNDPWGCTDEVGIKLQKKLGGKLVVLRGEGHMGSTKFNQPYKEFPLLLDLII